MEHYRKNIEVFKGLDLNVARIGYLKHITVEDIYKIYSQINPNFSLLDLKVKHVDITTKKGNRITDINNLRGMSETEYKKEKIAKSIHPLIYFGDENELWTGDISYGNYIIKTNKTAHHYFALNGVGAIAGLLFGTFGMMIKPDIINAVVILFGANCFHNFYMQNKYIRREANIMSIGISANMQSKVELGLALALNSMKKDKDIDLENLTERLVGEYVEKSSKTLEMQEREIYKYDEFTECINKIKI